MKGLTQNKRRNQTRNETRAQLSAMANAFNQKVDLIKLEKTATALLAMNMVKVTESGFRVFMATFQGRETFYDVTVSGEGKLVCDCYTFEENAICAHVVAAEKLIEKQMIEAAAREDEETDEPTKGFVNVTRAKVVAAIERVRNQEFSARVQKRDTGVYEVESLQSGEFYTVELNRGIFGVTAHCTCPDFTFTRLPKDEVCKHQAAVYQFERTDAVISLKAA